MRRQVSNHPPAGLPMRVELPSRLGYQVGKGGEDSDHGSDHHGCSGSIKEESWWRWQSIRAAADGVFAVRRRSAGAGAEKIDLQFQRWQDGRMGERLDGDSFARAGDASLAVLATGEIAATR